MNGIARTARRNEYRLFVIGPAADQRLAPLVLHHLSDARRGRLRQRPRHVDVLGNARGEALDADPRDRERARGQRLPDRVHHAFGAADEHAVDVVELHDCFSCNELVTYEALGLCPEGKAGVFVDSGANTYGGKVVVNPSGGLISKGHPLGATGLAQCAELNWQLRGQADKRQVPGAKVALQHNLGLGGAGIVAMYARA